MTSRFLKNSGVFGVKFYAVRPVALVPPLQSLAINEFFQEFSNSYCSKFEIKKCYLRNFKISKFKMQKCVSFNRVKR
jgi:hypothetical protein